MAGVVREQAFRMPLHPEDGVALDRLDDTVVAPRGGHQRSGIAYGLVVDRVDLGRGPERLLGQRAGLGADGGKPAAVRSWCSDPPNAMPSTCAPRQMPGTRLPSACAARTAAISPRSRAA